MTYIDALILGLLQGLTEFLPVSSSGHLIIARELLGLQTDFGLGVDAILHFATALAVIIYFRKDLLELLIGLKNIVIGKEVEKQTRTLLWALAIGTIPAVVLGLLLESKIVTAFRAPELVAWILVLGSLLFAVAEKASSKLSEKKELTVKKGVAVGFFQALAIFPGMSRSGATISGGMLMGLTREAAARLAFLLSLPIIIGAGSKKLLDLGGAGLQQDEWFVILFGVLVAFASGLLCIHYLLRFLKKHTLHVFIVYRLVLAFTVFLFI